MTDTSETAELTATDPGRTLAAFLLERIAEDEAVAEGAHHGPWGWRMNAWRRPQPEVVPAYDDGPGSRIAIIPDIGHKGDARHISRFDPARMLAECEAKRRIVGIHHQEDGGQVYIANYDPLRTYCDEDEMVWPCDTLRTVATVYADHPDYRDEWAVR